VLLAGAVCSSAQAAQAAQAVDVRGVRLWAGPDSTRVVVDLSGRAQHSLIVLKNPDRVVLDVPSARLSLASPAPAGAGAVKLVRMSRHSSEVRIVLELTHPQRAKSFLTQPNARYGYRLVVDLAGGAVAGGVVPMRAT